MSSSDAALEERAAGADSPSRTTGACSQQDESGRVHTPFEPVVLAATLSLIPILIIGADANSDGWQTFATVANWIIWGAFMTELVAVLVVAAQKRAALRAHWLDVAIVVLTIPLLGKALAWLRSPASSASRASGSSSVAPSKPKRRMTAGDTLRIAAILTVTAICLAGAAQYAFASGEFSTMWDGIWWPVTTVTTVGYGDLYPTTVQGRIIGIALMLVGISFLSLLTAAVAYRFVKDDRSNEHQQLVEMLRRIEADVAELKATHRSHSG